METQNPNTHLPTETQNLNQKPENNTLIPQTNKRVVVGLIALVFVLVCSTVYLVYQNNKLRKQISQFQPTQKAEIKIDKPSQPTQNNKVETIIQGKFAEFKDVYESEIFSRNNMLLWWISTDGLSIINKNSSGAESHLYNCEPTTSSKLDFKTATQQIGLSVDEVMKQNGYTSNTTNSSTSITDKQFYDYIQAYQKDEARCVFTASPDCGFSSKDKVERAYNNFSFACTNQFDENYEEQAVYLKDLGIKDAVVHVSHKSDTFVSLAVSYRRTGHQVIAKLVDGRWTKVHAGQDIPMCDVVNKYKIPKEFADNCWDEETKKILQNNL